MIGSQIKGYKFVDEIGQGGFSEIYKVIKNKETYAMKIVEKEMIEDQQLEKYIKNEVEVLRAINSKHVIQLYDFFEDSDYYYFVIECCDINTLLEYIVEQKPNKEICIQILIQILEGMKAIHRNKCLHRDLKLENILIKNGIFKIADFGLSAQSDMGESYIGTLKYMAPEVLNENQGHTYKADFWSVGVIFFFMLYKCFPFTNRKKLYKEQKQKCTPQFKLEAVLNEQLKEKQSSKQVVNLDPNLTELFKNFFVFDPQKRCPVKTFFNLKIFQNYLNKTQINDFVEVYLSLDKKFDHDIGATIYGGRQMSLIQIQSNHSLSDNKKPQKIQNQNKTQDNEIKIIQQNKQQEQEQKFVPIKIRKKFIDMNGQIKEEDDFQQFEVQIPQSNIQNSLADDENDEIVEENSVQILLKKHKDQLYADTEEQGTNFKSSGEQFKSKKINIRSSTLEESNARVDSFYQLQTNNQISQKVDKLQKNSSNMAKNLINAKTSSQTKREIIEIEDNLNNKSRECVFNLDSQQNALSRTNLLSQSKLNNEENLQSDEDDEEITPNSLQQTIQLLVTRLKHNNKLYKFGPYYEGGYDTNDLMIEMMNGGDLCSSPSGLTKTIRTSRDKEQTTKSDVRTMQSIKSTIFKQNIREGILEEIFLSEFEDIQGIYGFQINKYLFLQDSLNIVNKLLVTPHTFSLLCGLIAKTIIYQITQILNDIKTKKNIYSINKERYQIFINSDRCQVLKNKLQNDLKKWQHKFSFIQQTINYQHLPSYIKQSLEVDIFEENFNSYFKHQIREVICPIYKASYQLALKDLTDSPLKINRVLKGTLYLLLFMIINHVTSKIPKHFFGTFRPTNQQDFELYKIYIQGLNTEQLKLQIQQITKQTFGQKALDYLEQPLK